MGCSRRKNRRNNAASVMSHRVQCAPANRQTSPSRLDRTIRKPYDFEDREAGTAPQEPGWPSSRSAAASRRR